MTPYYYKIQRIIDGISGEVISQEVLDTVQTPVEHPLSLCLVGIS